MLEYPLCDRTVTVYRWEDGRVQRQVVDNCYYHYTYKQVTDMYGTRQDTGFLLIMPGSSQRVFVGDRIYDGVGPQITEAQWPTFLPVNVPGLGQVSYVNPVFWNGTVTHVEAGNK